MSPYEKAKEVEKEWKERQFCIEHYICPDCGSTLYAVENEDKGFADVYCSSCITTTKHKKYIFFGSIIQKQSHTWKGLI